MFSYFPNLYLITLKIDLTEPDTSLLFGLGLGVPEPSQGLPC